jgi:lipoprotein-anchoring transpeptidase ErfK/SrfK
MTMPGKTCLVPGATSGIGKETAAGLAALGATVIINYFYKGYAIHGYPSVPAYPASHGCVRITIPTMDRMWASLRIGMPVAIYRS